MAAHYRETCCPRVKTVLVYRYRHECSESSVTPVLQQNNSREFLMRPATLLTMGF